MNFVLPAGSSDTRVDAELTLKEDMTIWSILPHTHMRGKKWEVTAIYPDGRSEVDPQRAEVRLQLADRLRVQAAAGLPKGTKIHTAAWYDNSTANKANPDPTKDVYWGDQTWEEMQFTAITFSTDKHAGQDDRWRRETMSDAINKSGLGAGGAGARRGGGSRGDDVGGGTGRETGGGAHVQQGRRADLLQELHELPSAGRDRADVAARRTRTRAPGRSRSARASPPGTMPPWHADPAYGHFLNDRRLSDADRATLVAVGRRGRARGQPRRSAGAADLRERLDHRHARRGLHHERGLSDSGRRRNPVSVPRDRDQAHRRQVGAGVRGEGRRSEGASIT